MDFAYGVLPWTRHVRAGRDLLRRAFEAANEIGDLTYAAYCGNQLNTNLPMAGDPLVEEPGFCGHCAKKLLEIATTPSNVPGRRNRRCTEERRNSSN